MSRYAIVVTKSTVPVGTADKVRAEIDATLESAARSVEFDVVSNPEFLKEGAADRGLHEARPRRHRHGQSAHDRADARALRAVHAQPRSPHRHGHPLRGAHQYAANAMLATKISFMNELANIAERVGRGHREGARRHRLRSAHRLQLHLSGRRLWRLVLPEGRAGADALGARRRPRAADPRRRRGREQRARKQVLVDKMQQHFGASCRARPSRSGAWRSSRTPTTCARRRRARIIDSCWQAGAQVRAYDPVAGDEAQRIYGERAGLRALQERLRGARRAPTRSPSSPSGRNFAAPTSSASSSCSKSPVIFDGRNLYDPAMVERFGLQVLRHRAGQGAARRLTVSRC